MTRSLAETTLATGYTLSPSTRASSPAATADGSHSDPFDPRKSAAKSPVARRDCYTLTTSTRALVAIGYQQRFTSRIRINA
ncbi:MAG: hypothetical protein HKN33_07845 [Pyrinomonadaceae bacterium]|nr:hypothetical protein [Pyrinomonadaceae bacterium]